MNPIESPFHALLLLADSYNHSSPPSLFKGGGWKILALKQKGRLEKILKRGGSIQKGAPLLKGGTGKVKLKFS